MFKLHSLKTRIALTTLTIFIGGLWSLSYYSSRMLRDDMERLLGEQQASTTSIVAGQINEELASRLKAIDAVAGHAAATMTAGPKAMQAFVEQRHVLQSLFNGGVIAYDAGGTAIAEVPVAVGRVGTNYMQRDYMAGALIDGKPTIGKPVMGPRLAAPVFVMAVPVLDSHHKVIGALSGVINLGAPNFLDKITENRYGKSGYYLLEEPKGRSIITGSDKSRIMKPLPPPGVNALIDRHVQGFDDTGITVNPLGQEVLASARRVPAAGWFLVAALPTEEAFAPIRAMQRRMVLATLLLTLLASGLTWWLLRRQLAPALDTVKTLARMSDGSQPAQTLPVKQLDEIGQLIGGFNTLFETLSQGKAALQESEHLLRESDQRFRDMVNTTDGIVWEADAATFTFTFVSQKAERLLGFPVADWLQPGFWVDRLHPNDRIWAPDYCAACTGRLEPHDFEYRFIAKDGNAVWLRDMVTVVEEGGKPRWLRGLMVDISRTKKMEATLRASEERYRAVTRTANDAIVTIDSAGNIAYWNHGAQAMFGYGEAEAIGLQAIQLMPHRYRERHVAGLGRRAPGDQVHIDGRTIELEGRHKDGREFPLELSLAAWESSEGSFVTGIIRDISARRQTEASLRIAATAFESQEAMVITDANQTILKVNRAFVRITGYSEEDAVGRTPALLKSGRQDAAFYQSMREALARDNYWQGEIWNRRKSGELFPERLAISAVVDQRGTVTHYVGAFSDITQHKLAEDRIQQLAFSDALTDLPNRRLLMDRLHQALAASTRNRRRGALMLIDLDNFKTLNDTLGHDQGDVLLKDVARRLTHCVREGDTVARLGGDEFIIMLEGLGDTIDEAARQTEAISEKIFLSLNLPYQLTSGECRSTPSIGVTLFGDGDRSADELMKQADIAMYRAKAAGRNTLRFFDSEMQSVVTVRAALEHDLRQAVRLNQFLLYYQAQVDDSGRLTGAEALVRWLHPERGLVPPAEFIALTEETGLILPLGHWVLETACKQLVAWSAKPATAHLTLAVNVSVRQFRLPDFVDQVLAVLDATGASPQKLKLELTESLLIDDIDETIARMTALKARGVSFSLDDFGTGYSSLSYLKRLPLDQLKIDQSFVHDALTDSNNAAIARTVVALGQSLGLAVIAEGVETEAQRDFLASHGCLAYQGYYFSRPLPLADFEIFARRA